MEHIRKTSDLFVTHATAIAITALSLFMAVAATLFYLQGEASDHDEVMVMHTYEVTGHIQLLFNRIKDVELGQRGYIIAGNEDYLAPYRDALKDSLGEDAASSQLQQHHSVSEELAILRKLTQDNPVQQQNLDEMDNYIKELLDYWGSTIKARHDHGKAMAAQFDFHHGNQLMDDLRRLVSIMMAEENRLLSARIVADAASTREHDNLAFSGFALFYVVMVVSICFYQKRRKAANTTQRQLIEKLADSNTELERFAYVASHDMQEPLRMIASFGALLRSEYSSKLDANGQEYVHLVTESAIRMQNMVADLLEYARVGNDAVRLVVIDATEELQHVLENLSAAIHERRARVTCDPLPQVRVNPVQFMRLLQNLVGNGLKYQPEGALPQVHIAAEDQGDHWRFCVRDNGIGMPEEYLNQIFEPYKRLHTWDEYKGTGIGLALCKRIVENHGGKIWATSETGKGSAFYFTLPKIKQGE